MIKDWRRYIYVAGYTIVLIFASGTVIYMLMNSIALVQASFGGK